MDRSDVFNRKIDYIRRPRLDVYKQRQKAAKTYVIFVSDLSRVGKHTRVTLRALRLITGATLQLVVMTRAFSLYRGNVCPLSCRNSINLPLVDSATLRFGENEYEREIISSFAPWCNGR